MLLKYAIYGGKMASSSVVFGWHHQLDGHEFKKAPGVGDGQGSLVCCSPWGRPRMVRKYVLMLRGSNSPSKLQQKTKRIPLLKLES